MELSTEMNQGSLKKRLIPGLGKYVMTMDHLGLESREM